MHLSLLLFGLPSKRSQCSALCMLADRLLESSTRVLIWNYLLNEADGRKFYFCQRTGSQVGARSLVSHVALA
jgi:hypothetical protein